MLECCPDSYRDVVRLTQTVNKNSIQYYIKAIKHSNVPTSKHFNKKKQHSNVPTFKRYNKKTTKKT